MPVRVRRRTWIIGSIAVGTLAVLGGLIAAAHLPLTSERLRLTAESILAERLEGKVELESLTLRLLPEPHVVGTGLTVHHKGRTDVPPLISVKRFTLHSGFLALAHGHVSLVSLEGLDIEIPPGPEKTPEQELIEAKKDEQEQLAALQQRTASRLSPRKRGLRDVIIDSLVADQARLVVIPRDPDDAPKVWAMHQLRLHDLGADSAMPFHTLLTNGVPPGEIDASGTFGPWDSNEPDYTPLAGAFTLARADLSVFNGISGLVSAQGSFKGTLGTIRVNGQTDTPDFTITMAHHPIHLTTKYQALVDATNGDTMLEEVDASFLNTEVIAKGGVFDVKGAKGRLVKVEVTMNKGRIEDVLRLAINTPGAPMTGDLTLKGRLEIPAGDIDVSEKIIIDGSFNIGNGRFTDPGVQSKIGELSRRASGKMDEPARPAAVRSDFTGRFRLANATLHVPRVTFNVPGAVVDISGQFMMRPPQTIAFGGTLYADAKVSQMTTGFKSLLLKVVDPLFRRDGRTVVPLKITGTRSDPSFGLDVKRVFSRGND